MCWEVQKEISRGRIAYIYLTKPIPTVKKSLLWIIQKVLVLSFLKKNVESVSPMLFQEKVKNAEEDFQLL